MTQKEQILYELFGFETRHINYLINISAKYKYIYFETPKVGCSTIKRTLQKMEVDNTSQVPTDVHAKNLSPLLSPLQLEKDFTHYINDEYFKFTFVRNPYTRILSCYLDKMVTDLDEKKRMLPELGFSPTDKISFKVFLLAIKEQSYSKMNIHWMPQSILLASNNIILDFIGRQENFDNDLKKALAIINKTEPEANQIENEAPHAVGANKKLKEYMTEETIELIQEIYADDFSLYGYSKNPFSTEVLPSVDVNTYKENELVSIVIPCYNQAHYLEKCVQSTVTQSYQNIEIIIVNDGSTDNTQEVAENLKKSYPETLKIVNQCNKGLAEARNQGIANASGTYILPLDSDDIIDKNFIQSCLKVMMKDNVDIVSTDGQAFGSKNYKIIPRDFPECNLLYQNCLIVCSLYKREVWEKTNGYKQNMHGGYEDWEFWINAYKHEFTFKRCPETLFYYRTKEESMFTEAFKKDAYLKAKMVLNNQELYTTPYVKDSIATVKKTEDLADLYFYHEKDFSKSKKNFFVKIKNILSYDLGSKCQIITIDNSKIALCPLDSYENEASIQQLLKELNVENILFYASLRYEVAGLKHSPFSWSITQGIIDAEGSIFPFVQKSKRENTELQLLAYQRLTKYNDKQLDHQQHLLEKKDAWFKSNEVRITQQTQEITKLETENRTIKASIEKLISYSIKKHPIKKYKAYKSLLQTYYKLGRMKK